MTDTPTTPSRRTVLKAGAVTAGAAAVAGTGLATGAGAADALPAPGKSGIEHVVVVMMENRSFDHILGWLPGADGRQHGLHYPDRKGRRHPTHHLKTYQGLKFNDPDHSYAGGHSEYNGGRCNGWLTTSTNDEFCIGYYTADDLAFYRHAARYWTVCDRFFSSIMSATYPNRFYMHSAQTDRIDDSTSPFSTLPTIWDSLAKAGVSHAYYYSDIPFTALWGTKHLDISQPIAGFHTAAAAGLLPAVSFVDPRFVGEDQGYSGDDHPHADIRVGQAFLNRVYEAVTKGPGWDNTVLVITYDEWGGFFDHVRPHRAPDVVASHRLRGFRVPTFLISPLARRHHVAHHVYDHSSILKMIEWRWGLKPMTPRDKAARNIAETLDFGRKPDLTAPQWTVPGPHQLDPPPVHAVHSPHATEHEQQWLQLRTIARGLGFPVG